MTEKVSLRRQDGLPMPPVSPETPEALARWYRDRLLRDLDRGERALTIACFDTAPFGFPVSRRRGAAGCDGSALRPAGGGEPAYPMRRRGGLPGLSLSLEHVVRRT